MVDQNAEKLVPDYVQWLINRSDDMLNGALLLMPLEQLLHCWKKNLKIFDDGPAFRPFGHETLFIRDRNVVGKAFKGYRMDWDTAQGLSTKLRAVTSKSVIVAAAVDKGLFPIWEVEVQHNKVQGYKIKRSTKRPAYDVIVGYNLSGVDCYMMPNETELVRLAAGWTPYDHCSMDVAFVENAYKIIDFDEIPAKPVRISQV